MTLPVRIRSWRECRGLSQAALARKIGVSGEAVSQWEREGTTPSGRTATSPSRRNLDLLVAALDLTHEQFYGPVPAGETAPSTAA